MSIKKFAFDEGSQIPPTQYGYSSSFPTIFNTIKEMYVIFEYHISQ